MKTTTMETHIDTLLATALQSNLSGEQAVECVNQLLSVFKDANHILHREISTVDTYCFEDNLMVS